MVKDWRDCNPDDNPFGLTQFQMGRVDAYMKNNYTIEGDEIPQKIKKKRVLPFISQSLKECYGEYDVGHNFCLEICGDRIRCKKTTYKKHNSNI